ncbi:MAG: type II toxin-antitoxin system ParD family antitoxin [Candidatus Electrothrix sp. MAN1_4]|nr:type II toxin-antitoxin system ParD family antitoxin [Candidatus Electrothrix sp. MAN1_4]
MAKNTSVTLGSHFDNFVTGCLKNGRYGSASEVIRAGLRITKAGKERKRLKKESFQSRRAVARSSAFFC